MVKQPAHNNLLAPPGGDGFMLRLIMQAFSGSQRRHLQAMQHFIATAYNIVNMPATSYRAALLAEYAADTFKAISRGISLNPILQSWQHTVHVCNIQPELVQAFLTGMEMNTELSRFNKHEYADYLYGTAEAVGLMALQILCATNNELYLKLQEPAMAMATAIKKVSLLRSMKADFETHGRVYLPGVNYSTFSAAEKQAIEAEIQADFTFAKPAIRTLPRTARRGIYLLFTYYYSLFNYLKQAAPDDLKHGSTKISGTAGIKLMLSAIYEDTFKRSKTA